MPPFEGALALPGGFVLPHEDLIDTATRELVEETGLTVAGHHLEQLASYAAPDRDPRGRVLSVGHLALVPRSPRAAGGLRRGGERVAPVADDGRRSRSTTTGSSPTGVERARAKLEYTTLAAAFCPPEFTVSQLRGIYEAVWGAELDPRNFQRKVTGTPGFLVPTERLVTGGRGRPAQLFRRGPATALHPPMLRARRVVGDRGARRASDAGAVPTRSARPASLRPQRALPPRREPLRRPAPIVHERRVETRVEEGPQHVCGHLRVEAGPQPAARGERRDEPARTDQPLRLYLGEQGPHPVVRVGRRPQRHVDPCDPRARRHDELDVPGDQRVEVRAAANRAGRPGGRPWRCPRRHRRSPCRRRA